MWRHGRPQVLEMMQKGPNVELMLPRKLHGEANAIANEAEFWSLLEIEVDDNYSNLLAKIAWKIVEAHGCVSGDQDSRFGETHAQSLSYLPRARRLLREWKRTMRKISDSKNSNKHKRRREKLKEIMKERNKKFKKHLPHPATIGIRRSKCTRNSTIRPKYIAL